MSHGHRFFFVINGMIIFPVIFALGFTIIPIICLLRYCCVKLKMPNAPVKPTDPTKPTKPAEPKIGSSNEEWNAYRATMAEYREKKTKWKQEHSYFKENQSRLMIDYDKKRRAHSKQVSEYNTKVVEPTKGAFCRYCSNTTLHIIYCREACPELIKSLLSNYTPNHVSEEK